MNEQDYYIAAVSAKKGADKNLKWFAECCANVSGKRTAALAADCQCEVDTIEQYRNAYKLYYQMGVEIESEHVRKLWEKATIELWKSAARLHNKYSLSLQQTYEYLTTGQENHMSRESFAAHVDNKENKTPQWIRRLVDVSKKLGKMLGDYRSEIPAEYRDEFEQATEAYAAVLEKIANAEMEKGSLEAIGQDLFIAIRGEWY